jgi:Domain of unknown function (DUF4349)/Putative zinc-finger
MNKLIHPIEPEELMAYLDGELTADRATATATHLGECTECQGVVADLRSVSQNLEVWQVEPPNAPTPPAIATALAENRPALRNVFPAQRRSWREILGQRWPAVAWMGAAAVLLVAIGTVRFLGDHGNAVFSQVGSQMENSGPGRDRVTARLSPPPPPSAPVNGRKFQDLDKLSPGMAADSNGSFHGIGDLGANSVSGDGQPIADQQSNISNGVNPALMIARTVSLSIVVKDFAASRSSLDIILARHHGYFGQVNVSTPENAPRGLQASLRIPAPELSQSVADLKTLGHVENESQSGEEVTQQHIDLVARLKNSRETEQRFRTILEQRTGNAVEILQVEEGIARVRGDIERMEAEQKALEHRVDFATVELQLTEEYKAQLQVVPPSTSNRLSNAAVEGYRSMADGVVSLVLFLLSTGPSMLLWGVVLYFPARMVWKKVRRSFVS